jgi:Ca-activated chloride channel homolog
LRYTSPLDELAVRIQADGPAPPDVRSTALSGLRFTTERGRHVAEARRSDVHADEEMVLILRDRPRQAAVVEADTDGDVYFMLDDLPDPPAPPPARRLRRVGLLWDASLSRTHADLARERSLLERWLASLGDVEVDLTVFRNVPEHTRRLKVQAGNAEPVLRELEGIAYDGGTNLSALPLRGRVDAFLLFSDGLGTLGDAVPRPARAPVYAVGSSAQADHAALRRIAEASGGVYLNLARTTDDTVLRALGAPPFALLSVDAAAGTIADVLPRGARPVLGRVTVTGRLVSDEAVVTLRYGRGRTVLASRTMTLRRADAGRSGLVPRLWAQEMAAGLALDPDRRPDLVSLGRRFSLVTPATSLLVLETLEQHLAHGITPPPSRAAMRAEYLRLAAERKRDRVVQRSDKLARVAADWADYVDWWRRDFRTPAALGKPAGRARESRAPAAVPARPCPDDGGRIQGSVTDTEGAALPGVQVTATHAASGTAVFVVTDSTGAYRFCGLRQGRYSVRAQLPGFNTFQVERVAVHARVAATVPIRLEVAAVTETITVSASAAVLDAGTNEVGPGGATITVREWDPAMPYLAALKMAPAGRAYSVYLSQREVFGGSPAFFLDCADFFYRSGEPGLGLRILTSVLELKLDEPRLLRVVARRLQQADEHDLAVALFGRVAELRPEEPHSPRDLALALIARADRLRGSNASASGRVAEDYGRALDLLNEVVLGEWDGRFQGIEVLALVEANRVLGIVKRERLPLPRRVALDGSLQRALDMDLRIVLAWDTDMTDMDLRVTEPSGEVCSYTRTLTATGGRLSRDLTGGYGPEEYALRRARPGAYVIEANYYASSSASLLGATTAQATIVTDYGRPSEKTQSVTVRLSESDGAVFVGSAQFGRPAARK